MVNGMILEYTITQSVTEPFIRELAPHSYVWEMAVLVLFQSSCIHQAVTSYSTIQYLELQVKSDMSLRHF